MPHASKIVHPAGPDAPHAFDIIPLKPRNGTLDAKCPVCHGYGEWNTEIDLVSFRCKRAVCPRCMGAGWVETGSDPIGMPDIELSPKGQPEWVVRYVPGEDVADESIPAGNLASP
ncbi:hypothetical protein [Sphingomonas xinjiangensis]|uniref:Uncharacterized protein n=1 Tax=Sphingomonas xinjiangensis TaxID=643568 RepID=A0A840YQJ2_9SPHN|nr:hypothetical protein [Sphingomonas xinjiangensis]MBB5710992.1 hypothetical protein [Sphingomonas xinjiangensis]